MSINLSQIASQLGRALGPTQPITLQATTATQLQAVPAGQAVNGQVISVTPGAATADGIAASPNTARPGTGFNVTVQVNNQLLNLVSNRPLLAGALVSLQRATETTLLVQRLAPPVSTPAPQPATTNQNLAVALRAALPQQAQLQQTLNLLAQVAQRPPLPTSPPQTAPATPAQPSPPASVNTSTPSSTTTLTAPAATASASTRLLDVSSPGSARAAPVIDALQPLIRALPRLDGLISTNPQTVRETLLQTGSFLESRLAQLGQNNTSTTANTNAPPPTAGANLTTGDLKAALATAIQRIAQQTPGVATPLSGQPLNLTGFGSNTAELPVPTPPPGLTFPQVTASPAAADAPDDATTGLVLRLLANGLAKIRTNQLHGLHQSATAQADAPAGSTTQSLMLDIPVWHQQQITNFQLRVDEEHTGQQAGSDEPNQRQSRWHITLGFDLAPLGPMFVEAFLSEERIRTTIWADHTDTRQLAHSHLNQLANQFSAMGLTVDSLETRAGQPPQQTTRLDFNLVDVHT